MADNNNPKTNTGILAKAQKRLSRTKTKVLQNLGKADKTKDEAFNSHVTQLEELQERTQPLHKELNHYVSCVKNLCQASKSLQHSFQTVYEDGWPEKELMQEQLKTCDLLWNDYIQNLQDSVASPLNSFLHHFPAFKAKISKRGRKLVDYDNARHQLEVLNSAKKRDEVKIEKAQEDLKDAKKIYEEMNQELLSEMPAFYNSRCHFVSTLFTSLFGAEFLFHSEIGKVSASVGDSCQKFSSQSEPMDFKLNTSMSVNENGTSGLSSPPTPCSSEPPTSPQATDSPSPLYLNQIGQQDKQAEKDDKLNGVNDGDDNDDDKDDDTEDTDTDSENQQPSQVVVLARDESPSPQTVKSEGNYVKLCHDDEDEDEGHVDQVKEESNLYEEPASPTVPVKGVANGKGVSDDDDDDDDDEEEEEDDDDDSNVYTDTPINTPVHQPPPNTLYQVQATHRYTGEDVDELNFEPGEMIYVIKFENSEEQDEGWQMGIKQSDGVKGVFPENFTRKI